MKTVYNAIITNMIIAISVFIPVNSKATDDTTMKAITLGVGFSDYSQPFQSQIGLGMGAFPEYEGSDSYSVTALPLIGIRKPGAYFIKGGSINTNDGLASAGLTLLHMDYSEGSNLNMQITMGPLFRAYNGRDASNIDQLNGLDNIDGGVGAGGFIEFITDSWLANLSVSTQNVGNDNDGTLATFDITRTVFIKDDLKLSTGVSTSWADDDYMQSYFGVTSNQAAQSGLPGFNSKSGFKDVGIQMKASYMVSPRWSLEGQLGYWRFLNDAADSPIVKDEGSVDQVRGLIGFSYQFGN